MMCTFRFSLFFLLIFFHFDTHTSFLPSFRFDFPFFFNIFDLNVFLIIKVNHSMNENHTVRLIRMPLYHIDDADVLLLLDDADCHNNNMTHQKKQVFSCTHERNTQCYACCRARQRESSPIIIIIIIIIIVTVAKTTTRGNCTRDVFFPIQRC